MRSALSSGGPVTTSAAAGPDRADLTGKAAIRQAGLELFAARGYAGTSIREVAKAAGVSTALLFHHFGSKAGLREELDRWVIAEVSGAVRSAAREGSGTEVLTERFRGFAGVGRRHPLASDYVARILTEGGPEADALFDALLEATSAELAELERRGLIRGGEREPDRSMIVLFLELGPMIFRPMVERHLGAGLFEPESTERWVEGTVRLFKHGMVKEIEEDPNE